MLFIQIQKIALILSFFTSGFVSGSSYWSITNQLKVERRPYTRTVREPSTTGPTFISNFDKVLEPTFREMHRFCDGQCFYGPAACVATSNFEDCHVAASIASHSQDENGEMYCDFYGPDNLRTSFCSKSEAQVKYRKKSNNYDRFYTVTLHRTLPISPKELTCVDQWDIKTGRRCRRSEFIGISFINDQARNQTDLDEEDLWYVCAIDESHRTRVSMWTKISDSKLLKAQHIMGTMPHLESGAGVVFSKIVFDSDYSSMGCQFAIQESNMTLRNPPKNAAFFRDKSSPIRVKIGTGIVERDREDDSIIRPFYDNGIVHFKPKVYKGSDLKPTDQIFFDSIKVELFDPTSDLEETLSKQEEHEKIFKEIISKCDKPGKFPESYIACYPPNLQQNCIHTGRCAAMFIVEIPRSDTSFDTIKAYLYSLIPDYKGLRRVERPQGFASVGFSFDAQMGRDVVVTCHANGPSNMSILVSINFEKANLYPGKVDYNSLIYNTKTYRTLSQKTNQILCSWEMKTKFFVNMFDYEPDYMQIIRPGQSEKLEYNFKEQEVFVLLASGNRNYPNGGIVFHDFRDVLLKKFSRKKFLEIAYGNRNGPHLLVLTITFLFNFIMF